MSTLEVHPACRFGWPGATLRYHVHAEDADTIYVSPCDEPGFEAHLVDEHPEPGGVGGTLEVRFGRKTAGFA